MLIRILPIDRNYSTRRIRRQVHGPDLAAVQDKQITIPVVIPWALENYLLSTVPQEYTDLPPHYATFKPLIPIHDSGNYDPATAVLPSLRDTVAESGNLRYWVISKESMWSHQHHVIDETAELLWSLFNRFNQTHPAQAYDPSRIGTDTTACTAYLAQSFRRRIVLPQVPDTHRTSGTTKSGLPLREALLFRAWAMASPLPVNPPVTHGVSNGNHPLFTEQAVLDPFPDDDLFWRPGDEGTWDEEGAPAWTTPVV